MSHTLVPRDRTRRTSFDCAGCGARNAVSAETFHVDSYHVHRCPTCGSLVTVPLPTAEMLAQHYAGYNENYTAGMAADRYRREMPKRWAARLDLLVRLGARGRLADLAGSNGMFGSMAHARGFQVSVADFIPEARDLGFTTAQPADLSTVGGTPFEDASFDAVTLWSCIEHVTQPGACLAELARIARPGAICAIDTPLVGDWCERRFGARSHWIAPPEHLHLFSAQGLRSAVERAGFEVIHAAPFFERSVGRWLARRGRNLAVAAGGAAERIASVRRWAERRDTRVTQAGDIQLLIARRV